MQIQVLSPQDQAHVEFGGGKMIAQKPIGFSGEGSKLSRLGPIFYWAWGKSSGAGGIDPHPHKGFEILTYVLAGQGFHKDSLGTASSVKAGGVQVMQTGSGMWHSEGTEEPSEVLQIWFEPYLEEALKRAPEYANYAHEDFPVAHENGVTVKTILGTNSSIQLATDSTMYDVHMEVGSVYQPILKQNRSLGYLAIRGKGGYIGAEKLPFDHKDFVIVQSEADGLVTIEPRGEDLRIILIEFPTQVDYPLTRKKA